MDIDKLNIAIMNIPCKKTLSHFATVAEAKAYGRGLRDARHTAVEILLEHFKNDAEPSVAAGTSALEEALGHIRGLVDFAYAQGFHELGYDPVAVVRAALASPAVSQIAAPDCVHVWNDFGQLGGRNVSWCPRCDTLAWTGKEPATQQAVSHMDGAAVGTDWKRIVQNVILYHKQGIYDDKTALFKLRRSLEDTTTATTASASTITPWEDRTSQYETAEFSQIERMKAEIADLRAALAQQGASHAANAGDVDDAAIRTIATKAREFYLGYLSRHIPGDDIDAVRSAVTTDTVCRVIAFDLRAAIASSAAQEAK